MQVALIAPISQLRYCVGRPRQMMLPEFVHEPDYRHFFETAAGDGDHVMLDNGEFEHSPIDARRLLQMAYAYRVSEIVTPDTMGDSGKTLSQLYDFLPWWLELQRLDNYQPSLMAAIQGKTEEECRKHIYAVSKLNAITSIGIPKHLVKTVGNKDIRLELTTWTEQSLSGRFEIHFLGMTTVEEAELAAFIGVRSMDTSAPFIFAANAQAMTYQKPAPERQKWFRSLSEESFNPLIVEENIRYLDDKVSS